MKDFNFSVINLWCNKNLVDTQFLLWKIFELWNNNPNYNINFFSDPYDKDVDIVFINTCWFLSSGRYEVLENMEELLKYNKKIYLLGCGSKYWLDLDLTTDDWKKFKQLYDQNKGKIFILSWNDINAITLLDLIRWINRTKIGNYVFPSANRAYTNYMYGFEYLKIAEWCNNNCSFCIIPKIRWKQRSLPIDQIVSQIEDMVKSWIDEIILISQDSTRYGMDLYGKPALFDLLQVLENLSLDFKYRILYLYPDIVTLKQLEKLKSFSKFIPYFDIPFQHISPKILKNMKRFYDVAFIYRILDFIKENWAESFIRTNFIVWFPGETDEDFSQLVKFIQEWYFDNISVFAYHDEFLALSYKFSNKIPQEVIDQRMDTIVPIVNDYIDKRMKSKYVGKEVLWTIMDIENENSIWVKPYLHAPEIDPYHSISINNILQIVWNKVELNLWDKIIYEI